MVYNALISRTPNIAPQIRCILPRFCNSVWLSDADCRMRLARDWPSHWWPREGCALAITGALRRQLKLDVQLMKGWPHCELYLSTGSMEWLWGVLARRLFSFVLYCWIVCHFQYPIHRSQSGAGIWYCNMGRWTLRLSQPINCGGQGRFPMSDTSGVVFRRSQDLGLNNHSYDL